MNIDKFSLDGVSGAFEVERKLLEYTAIAEVVLIGKPNSGYGEIKAFVVLKDTYQASEELKKDIFEFIKNEKPDNTLSIEIEFVKDLPKTRSGKIIRRALRNEK